MARARRRTDRTEILELRVHGVSNTPPTSMLDLPVEKVERADGDDLGSFWTPTAEARAEAVAHPPGHRHHQRADVTREAYSWGSMARATNLPLTGALGAVGRGAARAAWTLVLPFGLANTAYWARPICTARPDDAARRASRGTAVAVRLYGLLLTLLVASSFATVAISLIGAQCFQPLLAADQPRAGQQIAAVCTQLPDTLKGLAARTPGQRTAILAVAVAAVVVLLGMLSHLGRVRYEDRTSSRHATVENRHPEDPAPEVVLATPGFWAHTHLTSASTTLHIAATLTFLVGMIAWDRVFGGVWACRDIRTITSSACLGTVGRSPDFLALLTAAAAVMVLVTRRLIIDSVRSVDVPARPRRRAGAAAAPSGKGSAGGLLTVAIATFITTLVLLNRLPAGGGVHDPRAGGEFSGLMAVPATLVALLLVLAVSALGWRGSRNPWTTIFLALSATVAFTGAAMNPAVSGTRLSPWLVGVGAVLVVGLLVRTVTALARGRSEQRAAEGWRGAGPGVFLLLAAGAAMVLSSLLVSGTTAYLNRPVDGARLELTPEIKEAAEAAWTGGPAYTVIQTSPSPAVRVTAPSAYVEFATATLLVVAATVVVLVAIAIRRTFSRALLAPRGLRYTPPPHTPQGRPLTARAMAQIVAARRNAAELQRAEVILGAIAALSFTALLLTLLTEAAPVTATLTDRPLVSVRGQWAPILLHLTPTQAALPVTAVGAVALLLIGSMVAASGTGGVTRPLGIVWDILCFLPRAAHPFGPPCYAERAVPELWGRIDAWLRGATDTHTRRAVVVSAHSLGALLTIAALFARDEDGWNDVGLLTYGVQVRPYFGRFLPDLLGPSTLGVPPCSAPNTLGYDPWTREVAHGSRTAKPRDGALSARLTITRRPGLCGGATRPPQPAWVSLWRRSDYLGFPAWGYHTNNIDRLAEEDDRTTYLFSVATHSGYPRTIAYQRGLEEVLARMGVPGAAAPPVQDVT